ncbi:MAG: hypothetical protein EBS42_10510 [Caulobacteraceae bacterium]|nr:hypothetical protein [Caulobacteraceae bacterium]
MLPSPPPYGGGFPPRDPRLPSLGRYPQIVGGQDVGREAMQAYEQRQAPLKEVAYARTGRDASTQAAQESREAGAGPDEEEATADELGGFHGLAQGAASGARHFYHAGKVVGYGVGALSGAVTGMAYGGVKALVNGLAASHESESDHEEEPAPARPREPAHRVVQHESARPAYLLDREEQPPAKKLSMIEKERIRIREKAAMEGEHPFRPFRPYPGR